MTMDINYVPARRETREFTLLIPGQRVLVATGRFAGCKGTVLNHRPGHRGPKATDLISVQLDSFKQQPQFYGYFEERRQFFRHRVDPLVVSSHEAW